MGIIYEVTKVIEICYGLLGNISHFRCTQSCKQSQVARRNGDWQLQWRILGNVCPPPGALSVKNAFSLIEEF